MMVGWREGPGWSVCVGWSCAAGILVCAARIVLRLEWFDDLGRSSVGWSYSIGVVRRVDVVPVPVGLTVWIFYLS